MVKRLGLSPDDIKLAFVNGKHAEMKTVLKDNDQVGLAPATGGM